MILIKKKFNQSNFNKNKNNFEFRKYQVSKISHKSNDFDSLKKNKTSYYKNQSNSLDQDKSRYNDIMNNLKKQGII